MLYKTTVLLLFLLSNFCIAQVNLPEWFERIEGDTIFNYNLTEVLTDAQNNIYIDINCSDNNNQKHFTLIKKYDVNGHLIWTRKINGLDYLNKMVLDKQANVYITGRWFGITQQSYNYFTAKFNANGDSLWVSTFDGTAHNIDMPYGISVDSMGNVFVTGESICEDNGVIFNTCLTIKYNSFGDTVWIKRIGYKGYDVCADNQSNVYVTFSETDTVSSVFSIVKYDSDGNFI